MAQAIDKPRPDLSKSMRRGLRRSRSTRQDWRAHRTRWQTIKGIVADGAEITIDDDAWSTLRDDPREHGSRKEIIGGINREIEVGQTYHGRNVSIKEFGAFVEVFPGKDGLVHISELADFALITEDVAKIGEMIRYASALTTKAA